MDIRVRVMPTYLFLLARFYLRIDEVLVRILDTRLFAERGKDFILREWTKREAKFDSIPSSVCFYFPTEFFLHKLR